MIIQYPPKQLKFHLEKWLKCMEKKVTQKAKAVRKVQNNFEWTYNTPRELTWKYDAKLGG